MDAHGMIWDPNVGQNDDPEVVAAVEAVIDGWDPKTTGGVRIDPKVFAYDLILELNRRGWSVARTDSLDAAWAEAEAALPEGCTLSLYWQLGLWHASYQHKHTECPGCGIIHQCEPERETVNWPSTGPTPAAALRALAEKLREVR